MSGPERMAQACGRDRALPAKTQVFGPQLAAVIKVRNSPFLRQEMCWLMYTVGTAPEQVE